jgi:hypothetical protein
MLDATPLLAAYASRRLAALQRMDPVKAQQRQLKTLLRHAAGTKFGERYSFGTIRTVADYQVRVPLRRYEDFWKEWWQPAFPSLVGVTWPGAISHIAASSGTTTGKTKYIPVSKQMVRSNRKAALDLLSHHLAAHPDTRIMGGRSFMLGGSTDLNLLAPGVYSGDLSGIAARNLPFWAKGRYFPPPRLARIADWNEKVDILAPLSLEANLRMIGGTASWLLSFLERAITLKSGATCIADIYPGLELLVHGGVNFAPYRRRFDELLEGSHAETREVYPASEGFVALADRGPADGMRLLFDNGIFFEFVPVEDLDSPTPTRHWLGNCEIGRNYAVVLTTNAGLWSYILGDTIRFVDRDGPRLIVTGRTSYTLSAFGEHLIGEEIESAVAGAAEKLGVHVSDYSVGALYPATSGDKGRHLYLIELSEPANRDVGERLAGEIDHALAEANLDYREHRAGDLQMLSPLVKLVPAGTFARWMQSRGKLGAQNKVPRIINDAELFASLRDAAKD